MKELSKFRGQILELDLYEGRLCGYKNEVAINSVCMWTRQSQNCPLNYDAFDDIPPEKIQRVIKNLYVCIRSHCVIPILIIFFVKAIIRMF